jgi:hypothetical protein
MAGFAYLSGGKNGIEVATTAKVENDFSRLQICMEDWNAYAGEGIEGTGRDGVEQ